MNIENTNEELANLKMKIEKIQMEIDNKRPWYLEPSTVVAALALLFSFGTTLVAYEKAKQQEYISSRIELRGVMERLSDLPIVNMEIIQKTNNNKPLAEQLTGQINAENIALSNQADAIIQRIENSDSGKGKILDIEFLTVATALLNSAQHKKARPLLEQAILRSRDAATEASALRSLASISLYFNDINEARIYMSRARNIYNKKLYSDEAELSKSINNATTEIQWTRLEFSLNNCQETIQHKLEAFNLIKVIPLTSVKEALFNQFTLLDTQTSKCNGQMN